MTDENLMTPTQPDQIHFVGEMNYFKITPNYQMQALHYMVTKCEVADKNSQLSFPIVDDTCPEELVEAAFLTQNPSQDFVGLEYR